MTAYIENLGYTHELGFEVRMNPLGNITGSYNEVFPNSRLKLSLSSQFPLSVGLNGLTIEDTLSLNLSSKIIAVVFFVNKNFSYSILENLPSLSLKFLLLLIIENRDLSENEIFKS